MDRFFKFTTGMLLGALLGAGLVLLFAPRSGDELRQMLQERLEVVVEEGREAAEARRLELQTQFESLKQPRAKEE